MTGWNLDEKKRRSVEVNADRSSRKLLLNTSWGSMYVLVRMAPQNVS